MANCIDKFSDICPYNDEEAVKALAEVAVNPVLTNISRYFFPEKASGYLAHQIKKVRGIEEFQTLVIVRILKRILERSASSFSYSGLDNIKGNKTIFFKASRSMKFEEIIKEIKESIK